MGVVFSTLCPRREDAVSSKKGAFGGLKKEIDIPMGTSMGGYAAKDAERKKLAKLSNEELIFGVKDDGPKQPCPFATMMKDMEKKDKKKYDMLMSDFKKDPNFKNMHGAEV